MEEDIRVIKEYIEYDKEHRIVTVFDEKPLFRDRLQNLLTRYKQQQKLINKLAEHIAICGLERSWTKTFEEDVEDIKKMFINEVEEEGD